MDTSDKAAKRKARRQAKKERQSAAAPAPAPTTTVQPPKQKLSIIRSGSAATPSPAPAAQPSPAAPTSPHPPPQKQSKPVPPSPAPAAQPTAAPTPPHQQSKPIPPSPAPVQQPAAAAAAAAPPPHQQQQQTQATATATAAKPKRSPRRRLVDDNTVVGLPPPPQVVGPPIGAQTRLFANYFPFRISPNCKVFQYAVDFEPALEASRLRSRIVYARKELGAAIVCDGQMLFTPQRVPDQEWQVEASEGSRVRARVRLIKEWAASEEVPYQLCNSLLKRFFRDLKMVLVGRSNYDPSKCISLPKHRLEVWPGVVTSIVPSQMGVTHLVCDVSHKAVRLDNVLDSINEISRNSRGAPNWHALVEQDVTNAVVLTRYNNQTYHVDGIDWNLTPASTFDWDGHGQTSFAEYVLRVYNKKVTDMRQPMLVTTRRQRSTYLIPEFCFRTGLTDRMRADYRVMADLATHTRPEPRRRVADVSAMVNRLATDATCKQQLDQWGMQLTPTIQPCTGTVLPTPNLCFRRGTVPGASEFRGERKADWTFSMSRTQVLSPGPQISSWAVIFPGDISQEVKGFVGMIMGSAAKLGFSLGNPSPMAVAGPRDFIPAVKAAAAEQHQLVLVVVHGENKHLYNSIKQIFTSESAIPVQVVRDKTLQNRRIDAIVSKIVLQMCCKIGGELWSMQQPPPETRDSMLIGIDVCHSTPIGSSVAGLTATINATFSRYYTSVAFQPRGQEIISTLSDFVAAAIAEYRKKNGRTPKNVFVYRDGVGDGQLDYVLHEEIPQIKEGFDKADKLSTPRLVFVVVKKRIHTRLFSSGPAPGSYTNPPAGTVCDSTITHNKWYDFFLISQSVTQGTVAPTHYHVIEDAVGMRPQALQNFTFQLCHMYYNWSGTIRVPAPCQYAHKLAFLIGQNVQRPPQDCLSDRLYFL